MNTIQILTSIGIILTILGTHGYIKGIIEVISSHGKRDMFIQLLLSIIGILMIYISNS